MDKKDFWDTILAQVQVDTSEVNFNTWFKGTGVEDIQGDKIIISVPSTFVKEWLSRKYHKKLLSNIKKVDKGINKIEYIVKKNKPTTKVREEKKKEDEEDNTSQMSFNEITNDPVTGLNSKYSFDNYVVGSFNNLAHAASSAISEEPGSLYNPLFIYSKSGLGKTHLVQATGNKIKDELKKRVFYIQGQEFVDEVISALRNNRMDEFREKYNKIDVLIIDDIQFLSNKEKTQEVFFHTFNDLYNNNKQIILSSDRPPREINALADRLRTRFEGGMMADISYPDIELRAAILKEKAKQKNFSIGNDVCLLVAENITRNIRELEGVLNKLIMQEKATKQKIDVKTTKDLLKKITQTPLETFSFNKILKSVAEFYEIEEKDIISKSRKRELVKSRQIIIYLLRKELSYSYPHIGKKIGKKDHTTIIHSYRKIEKKIKEDEDIREEIYLIRENILSC